MLFRKNYVPNMQVYQDAKSKKWFAESNHDNPFSRRVFVQYEDNSYGVIPWAEATRFDTLEDLMTSLYDYACACHKKDVMSQLTYNTVRIKL